MYPKMKITAGGRSFIAELADTEAAVRFAERLPLTLRMNDLHRNEKYRYLDFDLPTKSQQRVETIFEGDLMLYESNCAVLFYETFDSGYRYVRLGRITDTEGLREALGTGTAVVSFERAE